MKQLVLDIHPDAPPTLDNFVAGANEELLATLRALATGGERPLSHLYLWGPAGCGRSHLLRAVVAARLAAGRPAVHLDAAAAGAALPDTADLLLAVDDLDALAPEGEIALFNAFNRARTSGQSLLLAGARPPLGLALREDLRTRVGQCLVYEVQPLDDAARAAILATLAARRGLRLADELIDFLLRHGRRELPRLVAVLDALDRASLERKRPITLPLLRELMQAGLEI